ncbi:MAG: phosphatidate cytidylyltransferase [Bacteroidota bacterium]
MNNLLIRGLSGAVFVVIVIGSFLWGATPTAILFGIFMLMALLEFYNLFSSKVVGNAQKIYMTLFGVVMYTTVVWLSSYDGSLSRLRYGLPLLMIPFLQLLFSKIKEPVKGIAVQYLGFVYVVIPFIFMQQLYGFASADGWTYILGLFLIVWTNDTFAYLTGRAFGKTKLFESVSPNKTWEGTLGGFICAVLAAVIYGYFQSASIEFWAISGAIIALFAVLGDLVESKIKRTVGVKDTGALMPGHGGVLDRFDAVMFATPFFYYWLFLASGPLNFL